MPRGTRDHKEGIHGCLREVLLHEVSIYLHAMAVTHGGTIDLLLRLLPMGSFTMGTKCSRGQMRRCLLTPTDAHRRNYSPPETDAPGNWCTLRETCRDVEAAAARADETGSEKDRRELVRAMEAHRHAVHEVVDREQVWEELASCTVTLMKLRREERRLKESRHLSMSVDKVLYLAALLTAVALKYITDPAERAKFAEDAKLLASGQAVEIDDELLAAMSFGNLRFGRN